MLGAIFERVVEESPISVMVRGLMERSLAPEKINLIFEPNAQTQYTRELLFSRLVDLMSLVVCVSVKLNHWTPNCGADILIGNCSHVYP